jgi:F0F1-type ATP synthase assembly protein I
MVYNSAGLALPDWHRRTGTVAEAEPAAMMNSSDDNQAGRSGSKLSESGAMKSLVQVESLIQLALMLPVATVVGWLIGAGLDKWLHHHWIYIPGLLLGAAAGFVQIFRVVLAQSKG